MTSDHLSVCPQYPLSALHQPSPTTAKGEVGDGSRRASRRDARDAECHLPPPHPKPLRQQGLDQATFGPHCQQLHQSPDQPSHHRLQPDIRPHSIPFRKLRQPQQYLNMATRLVLVLGDLFIPDRAIVSPSTSTLHTTMKQPG
jgi:hypothetical protein